ncbi:NAD(+) diphosphatase [Microbacterium gorillae]|uniref:NAD(+) diphosphatase n=1 Tax=Microbacterium gorillae TaxID=1231063 RepID=UPI00058AFDFF|nr:NAD(+) diphosphatase [Microbacterium gorillae]
MNRIADTPETASTPVGFDRAGAERTADGLIAGLLADPSTRVVAVDADRVAGGADGAPLLFRPDDPGLAELIDDDTLVGFVGRLHGAPVLVRAVRRPQDAPWPALRTLTIADAPLVETLITAVALGRWFRDAGHCPVCGGTAPLTQAGWARRCSSCSREHFPRTDPAIIVAVTHGDRLLLGSNAMWEQNRFSCFAGFVEAGESLESAVVREVAEEAGVRVSDASYVGSQAWPYPRSLMLGFRAEAESETAARPDGEEILAVRWFTRAEIRAALAGESEIILPGSASIAHRLITEWVAAGA